MIAKNYKNLCFLLEETPKNPTNSRESHLKVIEQYLKLKEDGKKFHILEIYDTPKPKIDNRAIYQHYAKALILNYLAKQSTTSTTILLSPYKLYNILGFPEWLFDDELFDRKTQKYNDKKKLEEKRSKLICRAIKILESALKSAVNEELLENECTLEIKEKNGQKHIAKSFEKNNYEIEEIKILLEMNLNSKYQAYRNRILKARFNNRLKSVLENKFNWVCVRKIYKINIKNNEIISKYNNINITDYKNIIKNSI